ncbi:MAG: HAD family acid phosphatase [Coxiellaceae bacterium]|nr:HAD family acid phosphatase [Coxiellaceae bacterium]
MKRLACLLLMLFSMHSYAQFESNLSKLKQELETYHDSGQYTRDICVQVEAAKWYLRQRIAANAHSKHPKKLAIVLDIDETALSNYAMMKQYDFSGANVIWQHMQDASATVIEPTLDLYQMALRNNVTVFFVTGRTEDFRDATVKNLEHEGYREYGKLYMKPQDYQGQSASVYKCGIRRSLVKKEGYDIVLSMGDQASDNVGGYADRTFQLPNPYYLIP